MKSILAYFQIITPTGRSLLIWTLCDQIYMASSSTYIGLFYIIRKLVTAPFNWKKPEIQILSAKKVMAKMPLKLIEIKLNAYKISYITFNFFSFQCMSHGRWFQCVCTFLWFGGYFTSIETKIDVSAHKNISISSVLTTFLQ